MSLTLTTPTTTLAEDETFTIHGLSWEQYVAIGDALGDQAGLRTLYLDGSLTFVSPAHVHEWSRGRARLRSSRRSRLAARSSWRFSARRHSARGKGWLAWKGIELITFGKTPALMGGPQDIDLTIHHPPDLAIEVENSNKATKAMAIYARLGVPEVWRHDVRRDTLTFWALQPDGTYQAVPRSLGFPFLTPDDVLSQVKLAEEIKSRTRWFRQLTTWVQDVIRPRLAGDTP